VIQLEAIRIREFRGIRDLEIKPNRKSFAISGPNGSGKSGVVDAIQFGLTGEISRLSGKGTVGLTVLRHGPHVDRRDDPAEAEVALIIYVPAVNKTAVLTRNVKSAKTFTLVPDEPSVRAAIEEAAQHPELTLSRREIIKYIIVEAGERSKEIQALLKLEEIGNIRSVLSTARNRLSTAHTSAERDVTNAKDALRRHLDVKTLSEQEILAAVNPRRATLGLPALKELKADTAVNAGVLDAGGKQAFNKQSAARDLKALRDAQAGFSTLGAKDADTILEGLGALEADAALFEAVTRRSFVERGLALVDSPQCPLCDHEWEDEEHLKEHLKAKIAKSQQAEALQKRLLDSAAEIANHARRIGGLIGAVLPLAKSDSPDTLHTDLAAWSDRLSALVKGLATVEQIVAHKSDFQSGWIAAPATLQAGLAKLTEIVDAKADQSASVAAQTFLTLAHDRLEATRAAQRAERIAELAAKASNAAYKTYCDVSEEHLAGLYTAVEGDFSTYYREINADDEGAFKAKLEPSEGKLDLEVNFYDRGMFPPGAYHSEGHQDGMGVCLYLALMKRLLGERFQFAVLDDVVMSVDQSHRKEFCRLLRTQFPKTQFIITTHDKVWAKQMQTEGLVESKAGVAFHSWSVETGPIFEEIAEVWDQINADLSKNDVPTAAGRLRRHLEYISGELADQLGAQPIYRGDFSYDLGDLLPAVIGRHGELLKLATKAAQDWKDKDAAAAVEALKAARSEALTKYGGESWVINKALHYNEWATFSKGEFKSVVDAFRGLLLQFRCPRPDCGSWLYVTPRKGEPETLRCRCTQTANLNLKEK
jgi:ABC-type multidrug transport system ATPase subunit